MPSFASQQMTGRVCLVTGASRGIGRATALLLAERGANLVLAARGVDALERTAAEARQRGVEVLAVPADVSVQSARESLVAAAADRFDRVDCLVSNATNLDVYGDGTPESGLWEAHFHTDVLGAVRLTELVSEGMARRGRGSIVFVSSVSGKMAEGRWAGYGGMKAALIGAGKMLSAQLAPHGIRVNVVAPGTTRDPDAPVDAAKGDDPALLDELLRGIPAGRFGRYEEIAQVIAFLLCDQASWVLGQCLGVDGGQYPGVA